MTTILIVRVERALKRGGIGRAAGIGHATVVMDGSAAQVATPSSAGLTARELEQLDTAWRLLRHGPFNGTCLRRAIVGSYFLRRLDPKLRIGVTKRQGIVSAHAWVEIGKVGLDPDGAKVYQVLDSASKMGQ